MTEATARPWMVTNDVDIVGPGTDALAYVSTAGARGRTLAEARANALLIAQAVNAFDEIDAVRLRLLGHEFRAEQLETKLAETQGRIESLDASLRERERLRVTVERLRRENAALHEQAAAFAQRIAAQAELLSRRAEK